MPDDDSFDDEAARFGDPVHPDDRLWRHPSEIHKVPPPGARSIPDTVDFAPAPRRRTVAAAVAVSSLVGAAVAVSVIMITGVGERVVERWVEAPGPVQLAAPSTTTVSSTTTTTEASPPPPTMSELAEATSPSMAWITVVNGEDSTDCAGVVITTDGHLLTEAQPFEDYSSITVRLHDGSTEEGVLVGIDPLTDLAVIKVGRDDLAPAALGDPRDLTPGGVVLVLEPDETGKVAASAAMVNAVGTPARLESELTLYDMIRFDAPVPVELSGGPLLNGDGEVIGVTVRAGNGAPFGLATPIDAARVVATDIIEVGRARHPWLGIEGRQEQAHPVVLRVVEGSPAHDAGLLPRDVIVAVNDEPVPSMAAFVTAVRGHRPGQTITITYQRDGVEEQIAAELEVRDEPAPTPTQG
ncbi:MAG: S1C family serine protease [Acidimicrobiales bacterium]